MPFRIAPQSPVLGYDDVQPLFDRLAQQAEFNNQYKRDQLAQQDTLSRLDMEYRQAQANRPRYQAIPQAGGGIQVFDPNTGQVQPGLAPPPTAAPWTPTVADRTEARAGGYDYFYDGQQWVLRPLHNATGGGGGGAPGGNPMASPWPENTVLSTAGGGDLAMFSPDPTAYARNLDIVGNLANASYGLDPKAVAMRQALGSNTNRLNGALQYFGSQVGPAALPANTGAPGSILVNGVPLTHYGAGGGATTNGLTIRRIR